MSTVQFNRVCLLAKLTKKSNNQFLYVLMNLLKLKQLKKKINFENLFGNLRKVVIITIFKKRIIFTLHKQFFYA
jgi:hypothetical protein